MDRQDDTSETNDPLSAAERDLLKHFRRCSLRRQEAILRFTRKLASMAGRVIITHQVITNILPFRRRRDD